MKVLIQSIQNGDYVKVWDSVSMITYRPDGRPVLHRRKGESFTLELDKYKIVSIS